MKKEKRKNLQKTFSIERPPKSLTSPSLTSLTPHLPHFNHLPHLARFHILFYHFVTIHVGC